MFKAIPGYSRYVVDESGLVISHVNKKPKTLKIKIGSDGYPRVAMVPDSGGPSKWCLLHRVVLSAFVGPCPSGKEGRHLDGNPLNPNLENLCWSSHKENISDKKIHGTEYQSNRTHCPKGHEYSEENTRHRKDKPGRECRECGRIAMRAYNEKKRTFCP
jgi:hypothetical protein